MTSARIIRFMFKTRNELKFKITEKPGLSRVQDRLTDHRNKIRKIGEIEAVGLICILLPRFHLHTMGLFSLSPFLRVSSERI